MVRYYLAVDAEFAHTAAYELRGREYGRARLAEVDTTNPLMAGITPGAQVWMSHGDRTRRPMSCVVCDPKSIITIFSAIVLLVWNFAQN